MADYITTLAAEVGIPIWLFVAIAVWSFIWKLLGMWKSARKGSPVWFIVIAIFNTMGILPILYYFVFSELKFKSKPAKNKPAKRKKK